MENKKRNYITGIDGLRSIAVIGVILYHLAPRLMPGGYLGVALFFVISGFLMTDILLNEWHQRNKIGLKNFYIKRVRRIYPSLIVMLVVSGCVLWFISEDLMMNFKQVTLSSLFNVNNFWQLKHGSSYFDRFSNESPFTHLWSLSIEGQFYILWPILFALMVYKKKDYGILKTFIIVIGTISALLMTIFYQPEMINRLYYGTDTRIFSILIGALLAVAIDEHREKIASIPMRHKLITVMGSIIIIFVSLLFFKDSSAFVYQGGMFIFSIASALLLGSILFINQVNSLFTNRVFKWIGSRSYEIYLWQFPVMIAYDKVIKWNGSNQWFHILAQIVIILVLSELTYRLVYYLRFNVSYKRADIQKVLAKPSSKIVLILVAILLLFFTFSFATAPSGRSEASIALEKQLAGNQKKISKNQKASESTTKSNSSESSEEKTTETSSTTDTSSEDKSNDEAEQSIIQLSDKEKEFLSTIQLGAIGDSLLLSAAPEIQALFPKNHINAEVGLQLMDSAPLFESAKKDGQLGEVVLVVLGTNGSFTTGEMSNIMKYLTDQQVFFVNTMVERPWQTAVNQELNKTAETYDNVHIIDWKDYSEGQSEWFTEDNVHLQPIGAENFANLIGKTIYDQLKK